MTLGYGAEFLQALEPYMSVLADAPKYPVGDVVSRRTATDGLFDLVMPAWPVMDDVDMKSSTIKASDGYDIPTFHFTKRGTNTESAILYVHGGGYFTLSVQHYRKVLEVYTSYSGVPIIAVDMRLAPEHPFPTPLQDSYDALKYISEHSKEFGLDPARIIVLGDSAGGGLAAALALKARDEGLSPPIAKQMMIGSMIDDRTTATKNEELDAIATWAHNDNVTGWRAYLGSPDLVNSGEGKVHEYAAPGRAKSVRGLPRTYLEVPYLDIFRDENIAYAARIAQENIDTEIHIWRGVPHSFELFSPNIETTKLAIACRVRAMKDV